MVGSELKFRTVVDGREIFYKTAQEQQMDYYKLKCEHYITCYDEDGDEAYGCTND